MKIEDLGQEKFYDAIFNMRTPKALPAISIHHLIKPVHKIVSFRIKEERSLYTAEVIETLNTNKIYATKRFSNKLEMAEWLWFQLNEYKKLKGVDARKGKEARQFTRNASR